jgi:hypothetical protein
MKSRMRQIQHVACVAEKRSAYKVLVGKTPVRGSIYRRGKNFKSDLKKIGWVWIGFIWLWIEMSASIL